MKDTTRNQIEMVLRKFLKQLKVKKTISVNEILSLTRLVSAVTRSSGGNQSIAPEDDGDPNYHESLKS